MFLPFEFFEFFDFFSLWFKSNGADSAINSVLSVQGVFLFIRSSESPLAQLA